MHHPGLEQSRTVVSSRPLSPAGRLPDASANGARPQETMGGRSHRERKSRRGVCPPRGSLEGVQERHPCLSTEARQAKPVRRPKRQNRKRPHPSAEGGRLARSLPARNDGFSKWPPP